MYDLEEIFEKLNPQFFHGLLARPQMTWSRLRARNSLGHYDPAHNAIVVSRIFDNSGFLASPWSTSFITRCCT